MPLHESRDLRGKTVVSYSRDKSLLAAREVALLNGGYKVFSTMSEGSVRFEIQMGQCGVLLLCYTIPDPILHDLSELFSKHCKGGIIAFVMHPLRREESRHSDLCLLDSELPQSLHLIQDFSTTRTMSA